ncbi:hypothetical protein [Spongiivirga citrea]|uniref:DUF4221 domain-containing protein n=1 Tax=Spongiivirga citrea TaxID=1481457 RepID=A0A6M0CES7_9FLAO|nr:hypothetical protein [Spongiivirga citrea]NER16338.1 hypothetical protein [Spongiivirga citrea]
MSRFLLVFIILILSIACAKDEPKVNQEVDEVPFAVTILAKQGATDFQIDLLSDGTLGAPVNLFQKLELPESFNKTIVRDQLVSFHAWLRNDYSSHQIDLSTDGVMINRNYCFNEDSFEVVGIDNSQKYLAFISASVEASGATTFSLNVYDQVADECRSSVIPTIGFPSNFSARGDYFILFQQDSSDNRELLVYDMKDLSLDRITLTTDYNFSVNDDQNLYIFSRNGSYQVLDLENLSLINAGSNQIFENPITDGILDITIQDGKMAFFVLNPQPSTIVSSPLIYDFTSNTVIGDGKALFKLIDELEKQVQSPISIKTFKINLSTEQVVVGYNYFKDASTEIGGVAYIDFEGTLIYNKEIDFTPNQFVLRSN